LVPAIATTIFVLLVPPVSVVHAQPCGPGVFAPQCDGQCPTGQMCADSGGNCTCVPATSGCQNPTNPNGPPVCWGTCPSATMVCETFAGGCMCVQGPILCGNGAPDPGEGCDDGNTISGDGCDENCTPTACGNGVATAGEQCDGSDGGSCLNGCQPDCTCANGPPTKIQTKCFVAIAKLSAKYVSARQKAFIACVNSSIIDPGSCFVPDAQVIAKLDAQLADGLTKQCALTSADFDNMGFPGRCPDVNPLDGFTTADLQACMHDSHSTIVDDLMDVEYDPTLVGPLDPTQIRCQQALMKAGSLVVSSVLKNVQKCRNAILKGKIIGIPPAACAGLEPKTQAKIAKIATKAQLLIESSCDDPTVTSLAACTPDQATATGTAACIISTHTNAADNPIVSAPADLIDYEYATAPVCGDHEVNQAVEVCDGPDDGVCPGLCEPDCTCP
jgi:cysteine-rich repeat protein